MADRVDIVQGAVARAEVRDLAVHQGALALVRAASTVRLEQSAVAGIVADRVDLAAGSTALLVLAREVHGDVRPLVDWRSALVLGAACGLVLRLLGGGRRPS